MKSNNFVRYLINKNAHFSLHIFSWKLCWIQCVYGYNIIKCSVGEPLDPPVGQIHSNGASFAYLAPGPHNSIYACLIKSNSLICQGVMYNHWQFNFTANNITPSLCITYITVIQPSDNMQIMLTYPINTSTTVFIIIQFL